MLSILADQLMIFINFPLSFPNVPIPNKTKITTKVTPDSLTPFKELVVDLDD